MRRGQSALEFLMTYGWAFLVLLIMVSALHYYGVLSPDRFLPPIARASAGFFVLDHQFDSTTNAVSLQVINSLGVPIVLQEIRVSSTGFVCNSRELVIHPPGDWRAFYPVDNIYDMAQIVTWQPNQVYWIYVRCLNSVPVGSRLFFDVDVLYREVGSTYERRSAIFTVASQSQNSGIIPLEIGEACTVPNGCSSFFCDNNNLCALPDVSGGGVG